MENVLSVNGKPMFKFKKMIFSSKKSESFYLNLTKY